MIIQSAKTHLAGDAEFPPSCTRDFPFPAQLKWRLLVAPGGQEAQDALKHLEDREDHVVQQRKSMNGSLNLGVDIRKVYE